MYRYASNGGCYEGNKWVGSVPQAESLGRRPPFVSRAMAAQIRLSHRSDHPHVFQSVDPDECPWQLGQESRPRQFNDRDGLLTRDAFKVVEEFVEGSAAFEVVEEVLKRDSGSVKAWGAAEAVAVDPHDAEEWMAGRDQITDQSIGRYALDPFDQWIVSECRHESQGVG